jgi:hypothetical protein
MELWLLGAGAIVLIAITLWIVWPARTADAAVGTTVRGEEVSHIPMSESTKRDTAPQDERFENQYTSATADLSAGGVAAAIESAGGVAAAIDSMHEDPAGPGHRAPTQTRTDPWPAATIGTEPIGQASRSENYLQDLHPNQDSRSLAQPKVIGLGAGALLSLGGAIGGAWLYARWQRERNKPINRLRRGARDVASRLGEHIPDMDELPHGAAPVGGAASALLLTALLGTRALRRGDSNDQTEVVRDHARELLQESVREAFGHGREAMDRGREAVDLGREVIARRGEAMNRGRQVVERGIEKQSRHIEARKPMFMGLGFGGLALVAGGSYVVWRLLRGGDPTRGKNWYAGE